MVEPTAAASHHSGVLVAMGALETAVQHGWKKLDPTLRWLAVQVTGTRIGCSWCIDYGYYEGMNHGIDPAKVRAVTNWRDSDLFDERERAVLEYAEMATSTPGGGFRGRGGPGSVSTSADAGVRGARGLGGARELPVPLQRRSRPAQPGLLRHL